MQASNNNDQSPIPESHFQTLLEIGELNIVEWEHSGRLTAATPSLLEYSGYSSEDLAAGRLNFYELIPSRFHRKVRVALDRLRTTGKSSTLRLPYIRRDRSVAEALVSSVRLDQCGTRGRSWLSTVRRNSGPVPDSRFEHHLVGAVGHDLQSPLTAISLAASMVMRHGKLSPPQELLLRRIDASAEHARRIAVDLLDLARMKAGRVQLTRTDTTLHAVVEEALAEISTAHPEREIIVDCDDRCAGHWDVHRIGQVIINLLGNAIRYSPEHTPVTVRTRCEGTSSLLEVHNYGPPIPDNIRAHLFEPMTRGSTAHPYGHSAAGLGLYIVHQIVMAHDGSVTVESTEKAGTTFSVRLPCEPEEVSGSRECAPGAYEATQSAD